MASRYDSTDEPSASPDGDRENLPGEMLGEDLTEPGAYEVAADETEAEELSAGGARAANTDEVEVDDPSQLAAAQTVADRARSSRPARKAATAPKGTATTRARGTHAVASRPTGPAQFARESVDELKKVVWPSWPTVQQFFWAVLVFVLIVIAYVGLLDLGLGWLLLQLLG